MTQLPLTAAADCWLPAQMQDLQDRIRVLVPMVKEILDNAEDPNKLDSFLQEIVDELKSLQSGEQHQRTEFAKSEAVLGRVKSGAESVKKSPVGKRKRDQTSTATTTAAAPASDA